MLEKLLRSKWLVPVLTIIIIAAAIWGLLKLTEKVGENLAPIRPRVLVFGATWCGACPSPEAIQKLADDFPQADIEYYDVDEDNPAVVKYHISRTPTFIVCTEGQGCKVFFSLVSVRAWLTNGSFNQIDNYDGHQEIR